MKLVALVLLVATLGRAEEEKEEGEGKTRRELAEGLVFCESDDCYELLGVKSTANPTTIKRAYRRLAAEYHPDRCTGGDVAKCREVFPKYANAYEVLSSSEGRKNYDYVMANPYEFPGFFMRYSRPKYAPKSDLRVVFFFTVLIAAAAQLYIQRANYQRAVESIKRDPRSRYPERLKLVMERMDKEKAVASGATPKKNSGAARGEANSSKTGKKGEAAEKARKAAEAVLDAEMSSELPPQPTCTDTVAVDIFKLPLTIVYTGMWLMSGGMREPGYMTRRALGVDAATWEATDDEEKAKLVALELWVSENLVTFEAEEAKAVGGKKKAKRTAPKPGEVME